MTSTNTSPSAVSARLHRAGFTTVQTYGLEGIRVSRSVLGEVHVVVDHDHPRSAHRVAELLHAELQGWDGYTVRRQGDVHFYVAKSAPAPAAPKVSRRRQAEIAAGFMLDIGADAPAAPAAGADKIAAIVNDEPDTETPEGRTAWLRAFPTGTAPAFTAAPKRPTNAGQPVTDGRGRIGITTDQPAVRGTRAGQVGVMWVGRPYSNWERVADLTAVGQLVALDTEGGQA